MLKDHTCDGLAVLLCLCSDSKKPSNEELVLVVLLDKKGL